MDLTVRQSNTQSTCVRGTARRRRQKRKRVVESESEDDDDDDDNDDDSEVRRRHLLPGADTLCISFGDLYD